MNEGYKAWLQTLKAGDEVALRTSHYDRESYGIHAIDRVTATLFVLNDSRGTRIRRNNGYVAKDRDYRNIVEATPEVRNEQEMRLLAEWLSRLPAGPTNGWRNPPLNVLRALKAAYDVEVAK